MKSGVFNHVLYLAVYLWQLAVFCSESWLSVGVLLRAFDVSCSVSGSAILKYCSAADLR